MDCYCSWQRWRKSGAPTTGHMTAHEPIHSRRLGLSSLQAAPHGGFGINQDGSRPLLKGTATTKWSSPGPALRPVQPPFCDCPHSAPGKNATAYPAGAFSLAHFPPSSWSQSTNLRSGCGLSQIRLRIVANSRCSLGTSLRANENEYAHIHLVDLS